MRHEPATLTTADGVELEAEVGVPDAEAGSPWAGAVLAHPHPRYGGDMRSMLVEALFRSLPEAGVAAVRFNFRGVGRSGGRHAQGIDETLDVAAAIGAVAEVVEAAEAGATVEAVEAGATDDAGPVAVAAAEAGAKATAGPGPVVAGPVVAAGWSFGADVSLCVTDERLAGWFCMAPVIGVVDVDRMGAAQDPRPKLLAVPEHDQYRPPESARSLTSSWEACRVEVVPGTDHFFAGASGIATDLLVEFLRSLAPPPRPPRTLSR